MKQVYKADMPNELSLYQFIQGLASKIIKILKSSTRLAFVLIVWLVLLPFITSKVFHFYFYNNFKFEQLPISNHVLSDALDLKDPIL